VPVVCCYPRTPWQWCKCSVNDPTIIPPRLSPRSLSLFISTVRMCHVSMVMVGVWKCLAKSIWRCRWFKPWTKTWRLQRSQCVLPHKQSIPRAVNCDSLTVSRSSALLNQASQARSDKTCVFARQSPRRPTERLLGWASRELQNLRCVGFQHSKQFASAFRPWAEEND
jgi:hypothetical protein